LNPTMHIEDYPIKFMHTGDKGCGEVAFHYLERPINGSGIDMEKVIYPDGTIPFILEALVCGSCKQPLRIALERFH